MAKEIIRNLGQVKPIAVNDDYILYSVPSGKQAVISSIIACEVEGNIANIDIAIVPEAITHAQGKSRVIAANKLIDSLGDFSTVEINDLVQNTTTGGLTSVDSVDSDTQVTLFDDIFLSVSDNYIIHPSIPPTNFRHRIRRLYPMVAYGFHEVKSGLTLSEFTQIRVGSSDANVAFNCFGVEITADD